MRSLENKGQIVREEVVEYRGIVEKQNSFELKENNCIVEKYSK